MKSELADWNAFYTEGKSYHRTAQGSVKRPEVFTPTITENIAAMGIEKYFMAIFMHRGVLPRNHTMTDLLEEYKKTSPLEPGLEDTLRYMDSLQNICSVDDFRIVPPKPDDVPRFLAALDAIAAIADTELSGSRTTTD